MNFAQMHSTPYRRWQVCAVMVYFMVVAATFAAPATNSFKVLGDFTFTQYPRGGSPIVAQWLFRAEINGCKWRIRTALTPEDLTNTTGGYFSYGYDGKSQYQLSSTSTNAKTDLPAEVLATNPPVRKLARIINGGFVPYDASAISFVWLTLVSGCELQNGGKSPAVWYINRWARNDPNCWFVTETKPLSDSFSFPQRVTYFSGGSTIIDGGYKFAFPPPYQDGFRKAQYEVTETGTFDQLQYPKQFKFVVYNPKEVASSAEDLEVAWEVRGSITKIGLLTEKFDFVPETSGIVDLVDDRDPHARPFPILTEGWKNFDPDYSRKYRLVQEAMKEKDSRAPLIQKLVLGALALSGVIFFAIVFRTKKAKTMKT